MSESFESYSDKTHSGRKFCTTHWSVVLNAGSDDSSAGKALDELCRTYWYPLYAFARRKGFSSTDAQDLTQGFFARFIEKKYLDDVDQSKGKFRSFLLTSMTHFLLNEIDKNKAQKRGGGHKLISIDAELAEKRYSLEPSHDLSADKLFERNWALTLLDNVLNNLRGEYVEGGKELLFEQLKEVLTSGKTSRTYAEIATQLEMTEPAIKVAVHRLRTRYRKLIRAEIANTVSSPDDVDDELKHLFAVLSN